VSRICYIERSFYTKARAVVDQANAICEEYAAQGLDLTLRQLYYQFVARGLIANKQSEYDRLGSIVNDARLAGDLDWEFIVDRTRNLMGISHHDSPADLIRDAARRFHTDKWSNQPTRVEVWVEKDALVGVLESVCPSEDVDFFACRGYVSQSEMWAAAQRIERYIIAKQAVLVLHLGDHDPSGIDMTRDVRERLELFIREDLWNSAVNDLEVKRIALNMDQIELYNPPPNPVKLTDVRANGYVAEFGRQSWELDALEPSVLVDLVRSEIEACRDSDLWTAAVSREGEMRQALSAAASQVSSLLDGLS
jgi:hypothetical protein